jgi:hypothetical protein
VSVEGGEGGGERESLYPCFKYSANMFFVSCCPASRPKPFGKLNTIPLFLQALSFSVV